MKKRILLLSLLALLMSALAAPASLAAQSAERCFPETGYCITGKIRDYWERRGGLPVFGYPTTPQEIAANATIQYFDSGVAIRLSSGLFFAFGPLSEDVREDFLQ